MNLDLIRTLTEASAKLQESYRIAKQTGQTDIAASIFAASVRVSTVLGEVVTSRPRPVEATS
jgi:hypothetical protein